VLETTAFHFFHKCFMSYEQGFELAFPTPCFGMMPITPFPLREDRPHGMELAVFTQEMLSAQPGRSDIPDPHCTVYPFFCMKLA
jgi:hypothetical protein